MRALGARVTLARADFDAAKESARQQASEHSDCIFVEGRYRRHHFVPVCGDSETEPPPIFEKAHRHLRKQDC